MCCKTKNVLIIVLNFENSDLTIKCVKRLLEVEGELVRILIIDNASSQSEKVKLLRFAQTNMFMCLFERNLSIEDFNINEIKKHSRIILFLQHNYGYAKGNNFGLRLAHDAGYKYVLIMNNDIFIEEPIIDDLLNVLIKNDKIAVIGPKILEKEGNVRHPVIIRPNFFDMFWYKILYPFLFLPNLVRKALLTKIYTNNKKGNLSYPYYVQGSFMLLDLDIISNVGYFDENTFLYSEEAILSEKIMRVGYRVGYLESKYVKHLHESTTKQLFTRKQLNSFFWNSKIYYLTHYLNYGPTRISLILFADKLYNKLWHPIRILLAKMLRITRGGI